MKKTIILFKTKYGLLELDYDNLTSGIQIDTKKYNPNVLYEVHTKIKYVKRHN